MSKSSDHERAARRRKSFDEVATLYATARPAYPAALVDDLIALARDENVQRVLEIGPGTGHLTLPLAGAGFFVVAVELGARLARVLDQQLASFPNKEIVVADFDTWPGPRESFDLVVAAMAFHWLDPGTRVSKCASLLRPGGALAIVKTHWGAGAAGDRFAQESQACYARWDPEYDSTYRPLGPEDLPEQNEELQAAGLFREVIHRRYVREREYSADAYCALLETYSDVRVLDEEERTGLLDCMRRLIENRFDGKVRRSDACDLWFAKTDSLRRAR